MENTYIVKVTNLFSNLVEVTANNEEEAKQKAKEIISNQTEENNIPLRYDFTFPEDYWTALTKEEFIKLKAEFEKKAEQEIQEDNKL
jgi:hypothetical protein